jgi:hypothetical protein
LFIVSPFLLVSGNLIMPKRRRFTSTYARNRSGGVGLLHLHFLPGSAIVPVSKEQPMAIHGDRANPNASEPAMTETLLSFIAVGACAAAPGPDLPPTPHQDRQP